MAGLIMVSGGSMVGLILVSGESIKAQNGWANYGLWWEYMSSEWLG